jgi:phage baseplate assembly protein W
MDYYSLPFTPAPRNGNFFARVNTEMSVRQHINFLLTTMPGSFRFAPLYGSWLNKYHFHLPDKRQGEKKLEAGLKLEMQENLRFLLGRYEPRLKVDNLEVEVNFAKENEQRSKEKAGRITFRISITGTLNGGESFKHAEAFILR